MTKEMLPYELMMDRLRKVRTTAVEITHALEQQTQVASQFRSCISEWEREQQKGTEQKYADQGLLNKWKYLFYGLILSYTLMNVVIQLMMHRPVDAAESVIRNGILLVLLNLVWSKRSVPALLFKGILMLGWTRQVLSYFAISLEDLRHGVLWSPLLNVAVFVVAFFAISKLLRYQNTRVDRANAQIRQHNQTVDLQVDAQNREITARNQALQQQYGYLEEQIIGLRADLNRLTQGGWYPANHGEDSYFYSVQGIEDLINTLSSPRANTMQEALAYIDTRDYRRQVLAYQKAILQANQQILFNQQDILQNLRYVNVLSCAQIALQFQNSIDAQQRWQEWKSWQNQSYSSRY